jgi:outer membrane lipoprotein SlyB
MRHFSKAILATLAAATLLAGCSRNLNGDTYTSNNTVGKVTYGTIVSARSVTVKDHDKLEQNTIGGLGGGVAGGIAGSSIGGGTGKGIATVGGAILGAVAGAYAQDQLTTQTGFEYIVQLDSPRYNDRTKKKNVTIKGSDSVAQDVKDSMHTSETESDAISIVQTDAVMMQPGQRVMVVYNDDRPRVVPVR